MSRSRNKKQAVFYLENSPIIKLHGRFYNLPVELIDELVLVALEGAQENGHCARPGRRTIHAADSNSYEENFLNLNTTL